MAPPNRQSDNDDVHIQAQVAMLTERMRLMGATVDRHEDTMAGIFSRLSTIERLIYIGIGGILTFGSIATFFGWNILKLLGK